MALYNQIENLKNIPGMVITVLLFNEHCNYP